MTYARKFVSNCCASAGTVAAAQTMPDQSKEHKTASLQPSTENVVLKGGSDGEGTSKPAPAFEPSSGIVGENKKTSHVLQRTTVESVEDGHENSQKLAPVRFFTCFLLELLCCIIMVTTLALIGMLCILSLAFYSLAPSLMILNTDAEV